MDRKVNRNACLSVSKRNLLVGKMGLRSFLSQCARTLKLAVKPGRSELWLSIKICFLGIGAVGLIGFIIAMLTRLIPF
ncbi:MAG: protein translocase SEC61 complex subunit gamma [Candidatus Bathyarchaeia archaeon]